MIVQGAERLVGQWSGLAGGSQPIYCQSNKQKLKLKGFALNVTVAKHEQ